jgi:hypothetical protein
MQKLLQVNIFETPNQSNIPSEYKLLVNLPALTMFMLSGVVQSCDIILELSSSRGNSFPTKIRSRVQGFALVVESLCHPILF